MMMWHCASYLCTGIAVLCWQAAGSPSKTVWQMNTLPAGTLPYHSVSGMYHTVHTRYIPKDWAKPPTTYLTIIAQLLVACVRACMLPYLYCRQKRMYQYRIHNTAWTARNARSLLARHQKSEIFDSPVTENEGADKIRPKRFRKLAKLYKALQKGNSQKKFSTDHNFQRIHCTYFSCNSYVHNLKHSSKRWFTSKKLLLLYSSSCRPQ